MKTKLILLVTSLSALVCTVKASAPDKAQVEAHYKSYHAAGKAVVEMAITQKVDPAEVAKKVDIMIADALWLAGQYAKAHPKGAKLIGTYIENIATLRTLSYHDLETEWHDLGYFAKPGREAGLDIKAEENEHFTDPLHTLVHPLMVLRAAQSYAAGKKPDDLKAMKTEMEEGLEQAEKQKTTLLKS
jgi:hypothetical protein